MVEFNYLNAFNTWLASYMELVLLNIIKFRLRKCAFLFHDATPANNNFELLQEQIP